MNLRNNPTEKVVKPDFYFIGELFPLSLFHSCFLSTNSLLNDNDNKHYYLS